MESILLWLKQPWPWYVAGPLIGLIVPTLILGAGKMMGISSSFRHTCAMLPGTKRIPFLNYNWKSHAWNMLFVGGVALGGFVAVHLLSDASITLIPEYLNTTEGAIQLFLGGILVGFGSRYAGGCTSGHTIMGISSGQLASVVASVAFFAGGLSALALTKLFFS